MHVVDEAGAKILLDGGGASAEANIFTVGGVDGLFECAVNAVGDEVEGGASFHRDGRAGVVGQNEDGHVVGRGVAPPTFPGVVGPGSADGTEHVAAEDPGADVFKAPLDELVIHAGFAAGLAHHLMLGAGGELPIEDLHSADAERVLEALIGTGAVAVEGNRKAADKKLGHGEFLSMRTLEQFTTKHGAAEGEETRLRPKKCGGRETHRRCSFAR